MTLPKSSSGYLSTISEGSPARHVERGLLSGACVRLTSPPCLIGLITKKNRLSHGAAWAEGEEETPEFGDG